MRPIVPEQLRDQVFRGSVATASGLLTPDQLRGASWRPLFRDVYVHRAVQVTHELRIRGVVLLLPDAVVTGRSAALLWGLHLLGTEDDVEVTLPPGSHPRRIGGVRARLAGLPDGHVGRRRGLPVTTPAATAVRLAAALPHDDAVAAVDRLVATGVVDLGPMRALAAEGRGPASIRAQSVCALADGLSESPQETRLRLLIGRTSLPPPVAQFTVRHDGRFVARVDFAWPEHRLVLEYDGLWHAETGQFARDRRRLNRLRVAGWQVIHVTAADLHHPERLMSLLIAAIGG